MRHPVVRLDFSKGDYTQADYLNANVAARLDRFERRADIASRYATAPERFDHRLEALHERTGHRVAVLVDEYDKPILDALEKPVVARANRDSLRGLYSTVKFADARGRVGISDGSSGAATGAGLCGQVPGFGAADPSHRRGVQQGDAQSGGVGGNAGVT